MKNALFLYLNNIPYNITLISQEKTTNLTNFRPNPKVRLVLESANHLKDNCNCNGDEIAHPQNIFGFQCSCLGEPQIYLNIMVGLCIVVFDPNYIMYLSVPFSRKENKVDLVY